jgi:hypothetical protein
VRDRHALADAWTVIRKGVYWHGWQVLGVDWPGKRSCGMKRGSALGPVFRVKLRALHGHNLRITTGTNWPRSQACLQPP